MNCTTVLLRAVQCIIQFLKVMYLILTLQLPLTLPSVFSKTYSVFLKEDTQMCVINNTCPRACISQYTPMGVYWLVQALGHVLSNTHSWGLYSTVPGGDGCTVQYLEVMAVWYSAWRWWLYSTVPGGDGCMVQYMEVMAVQYSTWRWGLYGTVPGSEGCTVQYL